MLPPPCSTWRMIWSSVMRVAIAVERRSALAARASERMAVAALLVLQHEGALSFKRRAAVQVFGRNGVAATRRP